MVHIHRHNIFSVILMFPKSFTTKSLDYNTNLTQIFFSFHYTKKKTNTKQPLIIRVNYPRTHFTSIKQILL